MGDRVYIRDENVTGEIVTLMAHGAIVKYFAGGIEFTVLLDEDDYRLLDDMFFNHEED